MALLLCLTLCAVHYQIWLYTDAQALIIIQGGMAAPFCDERLINGKPAGEAARKC
jgi:hypothetical protein